MQAQEGKSEVARLLRRIDEEYEAAQRALTGMAAGVARHDFIEARMEHIGLCHQQLQGLVGEHEAIRLVYERVASEETEAGA